MTEAYIGAPELDGTDRGTAGSLVADCIENTLRNKGHEYVSLSQLKFWQRFRIKNGRSVDLSLPAAEDEVNGFGKPPGTDEQCTWGALDLNGAGSTTTPRSLLRSSRQPRSPHFR